MYSSSCLYWKIRPNCCPTFCVLSHPVLNCRDYHNVQRPECTLLYLTLTVLLASYDHAHQVYTVLISFCVVWLATLPECVVGHIVVSLPHPNAILYQISQANPVKKVVIQEAKE